MQGYLQLVDFLHPGGKGNGEQWTHQFVVSPRLPDDVTDMTFKFSW